ncbi:host-nuclease inhibitor Gam family protein (plasmid) [Paenibacillus peoriae]|uniref:Host-nuclease inhibitor Gam family protein n=1 Tax=Paenibacillus peoriae TaxID=59893 RepID=A0A7H0YH36_9BACL|nr:host-nuclease inhibitor Gam family protein [Paenibacillus peoriae]QNR70394.1 host-nuclease inhibitor Gam family protein [Paenibacillus peoriae]
MPTDNKMTPDPAKIFIPHPDTGELTEAGADVEALKDLAMPKRIQDLKEAADYAYGLSETRKELEELNEVREDQIAKLKAQIDAIEEWHSTVSSPLQGKVDYFTLLLSDFHQRQYHEADSDKARKKVTSIKLPYGITLASRSQAPSLNITDDAALLQYAKQNNAVQVTEKPKWSEIKKTLQVHEDGRVFDANGEEVQFVKAAPQDRKFEVK